MKKLFLKMLVLALFAIFAILIVKGWGERIGMETREQRDVWLRYVLAGWLCGAAFLIYPHVKALLRVRALGAKWFSAFGTSANGSTLAAIAKASDNERKSVDPFSAMIDNLSMEHGRAWRDVLPWLLVTGEDVFVAHLLPNLAKQGWLATPDVVLLWKKRDAKGRIDAAWLAELLKLRPTRPIDAIVMLLDGSKGFSAQRHGTHRWSAMVVHAGNALDWHAPLYALEFGVASLPVNAQTPVIGSLLPSAGDAAVIEAKLNWLGNHLGDRGVSQVASNPSNCYGAQLSKHLDSHSQPLSAWLASLASYRRPLVVRGVFFTPEPTAQSRFSTEDMPVWRFVGDDARARPSQAVRLQRRDLAFRTGMAACAITSCAVLVAGMSNGHALHVTRQVLDNLAGAPDAAGRTYALLALQQRIGFYEGRIKHGVPIWTKLGFNRDKTILDALWGAYGAASAEVLVAPIKQHLEAALQPLVAVANAPGARRGDQRKLPHTKSVVVSIPDPTHRGAHNTARRSASIGPSTNRYAILKAYLMLSQPSHLDSAFLMPILAPILAEHWSQDAVLSVGERLDVSDRLIRFYTRHLPQHPAWGISADINAVTATQQSILSTHLATRSLDTVYREILARFAHTYPDQTLASLIGAKDASGLFHTAVTVPGVFTRAAYDGAIANAIDAAAANSTVPNDWVLGTDAPALAIEGSTAEVRNRVDVANAAKGASFKARLRDRYFGDYANHWQAMMNSLQWEGAPTMPVAIDQAQRLTDPRHSPLNALMRSLAYQGSIGGAAHASLPNIGTIPGIAAASKMLPFPVVDQGNSIDVPHHHAQSLPMLAVFRPIFQLLGQHPAPANANAGVASEYTDASLVRFMDKLTALRLKLQQTSGVPANAADLRTKQTLRALFEGSDPSLADAQSYARWAQASMGSEWAGMADALFVRPIAQLGRQVAQSAQDGINAAWHKTILATWHRSFAGRYPFAPSNNDASIPELVRFIRPDGGLIDNFVRTHLAGMLQREGNQWVPISFAAATPTFDPEFLLALNTLQRIASHLQAHGDLQYRFDLQPVPTPGLTDTILLLDGKRLRYSIHYFNERETWHAFRWPALHPDNPGTRLQWQTINAGTNKNFEFQGRWAWLRMLEMAEVVPIDGAMFKLTWQSIPDVREPDSASTATADDSLASRDALRRAPSALNYPISYLIRTDRGRGPHNLLALRDFVMPSRIFMDTAPTVETESL